MNQRLQSPNAARSLFREDDSLWFQVAPRMTVIRAAARSGGPGRLTVGGIGARCKVARINGQIVTPRNVRGRLVFDLPDLAGRGARVELELTTPVS